MTQLHPVPDEVAKEPERVMDTSAFRAMSIAKGHVLVARWDGLMRSEQQTFLHDYREMGMDDLEEKYRQHPLFVDSASHSQFRARIYAVLDHAKEPRNNQQAPHKPKPAAKKKRVTPQSTVAAFNPQETVIPAFALQSLAGALMPYMRDMLIDDLVTALGLVKQARGGS